jgi:hypothetical protein
MGGPGSGRKKGGVSKTKKATNASELKSMAKSENRKIAKGMAKLYKAKG